MSCCWKFADVSVLCRLVKVIAAYGIDVVVVLVVEVVDSIVEVVDVVDTDDVVATATVVTF